MNEGHSKSSGNRISAGVDFTTLVLSFASVALINMGRSPDPVSGKSIRDLAVAEQNIDILELLRQKTRGNLSVEEEETLNQVLCELRCAFTEVEREGS